MKLLPNYAEPSVNPLSATFVLSLAHHRNLLNIHLLLGPSDTQPPLLIIHISTDNARMILVQSHTHPRLIPEHVVNLLQTSARSLDTEEPRQRHKGRVHDRPYPEIVAADVCKTDRRHHHDHKVAHPMPEYTDSCGLIANAKRLDLSGVRPADGKNTEGEAVHEEEHKGYCDDGVCVGGVDECTGDDGHTCCTANAREDDGPAAAETIDVEVWRPGEDGILSEGD
jgi:hypothetical protein